MFSLRVVSRVILVTSLAMGASVAAAQNRSSSAPPPAPPQAAAPQTDSARSSSTVSPAMAVSRDVCAKHPNLKQCS
jgi:hypothetical protein